MKNLIRTTLIAAILLTSRSVFGADVSIGITIGTPPPPVAVVAPPPMPGPDFVWVTGYWYPAGKRYKWHEGYWTQPPYLGAAWVAPRYDGGRFFVGYWRGPQGRLEHDHRWDRERDRDCHKGRHKGHGHQDDQGHDH
jgi:hypothetical protein